MRRPLPLVVALVVSAPAWLYAAPTPTVPEHAAPAVEAALEAAPTADATAEAAAEAAAEAHGAEHAVDEHAAPATSLDPRPKVLRPAPQPLKRPNLHPAMPLLDANGTNVRDSGQPISATKTCGTCHDAEYIDSHGFHSMAGATEPKLEGQRAWDLSPGLYGRWDPLAYDRLSLPHDPNADLSHTDWIKQTVRHPGGGPARTLGAAQADPAHPGRLKVRSGEATGAAVELNCFVCHSAHANTDARMAALEKGDYPWASTATLLGVSDLVQHDADGEGWRYDPSLFDAQGLVNAQALGLGSPRDTNCGTCHGAVFDFDTPVTWTPGLGTRTTETMGTIYAPARVKASNLNLVDKAEQSQPWDIHAERMLDCVDCHGAGNKASARKELDATRPAHLRQDTRAQSLEAYLHRPSHNLTKGDSAQSTVANNLDGTMRRCEDCHDAEQTHDWLPFKKRHFQTMLCETCHIPEIKAPARRQTDWTILTAEGAPVVEYRGLEGVAGTPEALITGYRPVVLARKTNDLLGVKLAPHNLVTSWYWTQAKGGKVSPVRAADLKAAFLVGTAHHADVVAALDTNNDKTLQISELRLDTEAKLNAARARLEAVGVVDPKIVGEVQPYSIHHGVVTGRHVTRTCESCHGDDSAVRSPMMLSSYTPFGAEAKVVGDTNVAFNGRIRQTDEGLMYAPSTQRNGLYVLGSDRPLLADLIGLLAFFSVLLGTMVHGGLRVLAAYKNRSAS